jgi:hypothetical protein
MRKGAAVLLTSAVIQIAVAIFVAIFMEVDIPLREAANLRIASALDSNVTSGSVGIISPIPKS